MKKWILGASLSLDFASASEILSFSAISKGGNKHLIQVLSIDKEVVTYIDLSEHAKAKSLSPFDLFDKSSFDLLHEDLKKLDPQKEKTKYSALISPLSFTKHHLCAGLNYKDHVQESGQKEELVLFPKYGEVTGHNSAVIHSKNQALPELLDYEIELGVVFDRDIQNKNDLDNAIAAFMITNDFSDRAPQIFYFGKEGKPSSYSFAAAKSKMNYTLVSPVVVIPKDWKAFSKNLEMKLYVNGELRQSSSTSMMTASIEDMLLKALETTHQEEWPLLNKEGVIDESLAIKLLPQNHEQKYYLPKGSLFMTGTPGGTVFQKPKAIQLLSAAIKAPFVESSLPLSTFKDKVKVSLIKNLSDSGIYLHAGDLVESKIDNLGFLNFSISEKL